MKYRAERDRVGVRGRGEGSLDNRSTLAERSLAITEQITHIGSWEWQLEANTVRWSDELYRIYGFAPRSRSITPEFFLSRVYPEDRERVQQGVRHALERGGKFHWRERIVRPDGSVRLLDTVGEVLRSERSTSLLGTCRDVTDEQQRLDQVRRFADICHNIQIGLSVWAIDESTDVRSFVLTTFNPVFESIAGVPLAPLLGQPFRAVFPQAADGAIEALLGDVAHGQQTHEVDVALTGGDGHSRHFSCKGFPLPGPSVGLALLDVTQQTRESALQTAEHAVLELVATGAPLQVALETLIRAVEAHAPPTIGSTLLLDSDGIRVHHCAAPGLPESYRTAIDGSRIGPKAGSCGTAAFLRRPVFVDDIASDALWEDYRSLALAHGLRACWSTPILSSDQRVLGTFAFYYETPRKPTAADQALVERASRLAGIAIERQQTETLLRNLSAHVQTALENERTRISREIHDDLGQSLTALKMDIAWILRRASAAGSSLPPEIGEKLASMSSFTDGVIQRVRQIASELRPGVLDDLGLVAAIEWQAQAFEERTGTQCLVRSENTELTLQRELCTAAFRIFQEALTNVARHAGAQRVEVSIVTCESELFIDIEDDGVGIPPERATNPTSLGLLGIRERAQRWNGDVIVAPTTPHGTRVSLRLPIRPGGPP